MQVDASKQQNHEQTLHAESRVLHAETSHSNRTDPIRGEKKSRYDLEAALPTNLRAILIAKEKGRPQAASSPNS